MPLPAPLAGSRQAPSRGSPRAVPAGGPFTPWPGRPPSARLAAVVAPAPAAEAVAGAHGVPWYRSLAELLEQDRPDGVVLATPNRLHVQGGLACVAAGVPTLVEKPIADTVQAATRLVEAAEAAGGPPLAGHHP